MISVQYVKKKLGLDDVFIFDENNNESHIWNNLNSDNNILFIYNNKHCGNFLKNTIDVITSINISTTTWNTKYSMISLKDFNKSYIAIDWPDKLDIILLDIDGNNLLFDTFENNDFYKVII